MCKKHGDDWVQVTDTVFILGLSRHNTKGTFTIALVYKPVGLILLHDVGVCVCQTLTHYSNGSVCCGLKNESRRQKTSGKGVKECNCRRNCLC